MYRVLRESLSVTVDLEALPVQLELQHCLEVGMDENNQFVGMPGCPSSVARGVAEVERQAIFRAAFEEPSDLIRSTEQEIRSSLPPGAPCLDLGTAGLTLAISSIGGYPTSSCNAGVFGEREHHEDFPLVAFFCTRKVFEIVLPVARRHSLGLYSSDENGQVVIFANDISNFPEAALQLLNDSTFTR